MIPRPPKTNQSGSSAASVVYKRQVIGERRSANRDDDPARGRRSAPERARREWRDAFLSFIHISAPTRPY